MRHWTAFVAAVVAAACAEPAATDAPGTAGANAALVASEQSELAPPVVFNTQMRSELEFPECITESKGLAQIKVLEDGTIESLVMINNKGAEVVRFGHIHHLNPGAPTGPVIWWLTPVNTLLNLTEEHLEFRQQGVFVSGEGQQQHFATEAEALAALLSDPGSFYVNFHSQRCPPGFARGFLH